MTRAGLTCPNWGYTFGPIVIFFSSTLVSRSQKKEQAIIFSLLWRYPSKRAQGSESISGYHPNHAQKREAIFWTARMMGEGTGGLGQGVDMCAWRGDSFLTGLRKARHASQRKSLNHIVRTKSAIAAGSSISLSWHYRWWYLRVWLCVYTCACTCLCVVWKWGGQGWQRVLKALSFASCLLNSTASMNHHRCCF